MKRLGRGPVCGCRFRARRGLIRDPRLISEVSWAESKCLSLPS